MPYFRAGIVLSREVPWHSACTHRISLRLRQTSVNYVYSRSMKAPSIARTRAGTQYFVSGFHTQMMNTSVVYISSRRGIHQAQARLPLLILVPVYTWPSSIKGVSLFSSVRVGELQRPCPIVPRGPDVMNHSGMTLVVPDHCRPM